MFTIDMCVFLIVSIIFSTGYNKFFYGYKIYLLFDKM